MSAGKGYRGGRRVTSAYYDRYSLIDFSKGAEKVPNKAETPLSDSEAVKILGVSNKDLRPTKIRTNKPKRA